jgi:hypothetical protein
MARGKRRRGAPKREYEELDVSRLRLSIPHVELKRGIEFQVQQTMGSNAEEGKTWICPMCVVVIEQGVVHTVAWDVHRGVQSRRHFHNNCWKLFDGLLP